MKFFYDTEFKEDGKTIDLISIGIVAEDGREFYAVSDEFNTQRVAQDWWLMKNVISSIGHESYVDFDPITEKPFKNFILTDEAAMSREDIRKGIVEFVGKDRPEFWAWFSAYDHVCLAQLFGKMIDLPDNFPYLTYDIKQEMDMLKLTHDDMPKQPQGKHNALEDARMNVVRYNFIRDYEQSILDGK